MSKTYTIRLDTVEAPASVALAPAVRREDARALLAWGRGARRRGLRSGLASVSGGFSRGSPGALSVGRRVRGDAGEQDARHAVRYYGGGLAAAPRGPPGGCVWGREQGVDWR